MSGNVYCLLICYLNFLSKETKENLTYYLDSGILASALLEIFEQDLSPEWFGEDFDYDSLYGSSRWLGKAMAEAFRSLLTERVSSAVGTKVRIAESEEESVASLERLGVVEADARKFAEELEKILLKREAERKKSPV